MHHRSLPTCTSQPSVTLQLSVLLLMEKLYTASCHWQQLYDVVTSAGTLCNCTVLLPAAEF